MTTLLITLLATLTVFTGLWVLSLQVRDASIVDIYWGPGFVVIGWLAVALTGGWRFMHLDSFEILFLAALTSWGLRLGWHIFRRHRGEDARYRAMRERHAENFGRWSLWMVFGLQAVIQWLASSPALVVTTHQRIASIPSMTLDAMLICYLVGGLLFVTGFTLEVMADRAVAQFKANPANQGHLLTSGLHGYVRHPNYLGEIILQWGLGFMAFGLAAMNPLALLGPVLMTALIIKLSGVPMLEEQLRHRPGFAEWKARTGALWPRR